MPAAMPPACCATSTGAGAGAGAGAVASPGSRPSTGIVAETGKGILGGTRTGAGGGGDALGFAAVGMSGLLAAVIDDDFFDEPEEPESSRAQMGATATCATVPVPMADGAMSAMAPIAAAPEQDAGEREGMLPLLDLDEGPD